VWSLSASRRSLQPSAFVVDLQRLLVTGAGDQTQDPQRRRDPCSGWRNASISG